MAATLTACLSGDKGSCEKHQDCLGGFICSQGTCVSAFVDASFSADVGTADRTLAPDVRGERDPVCSCDAGSVHADSAQPPPPLALVVEDFERGPGVPLAIENSCMEPVFAGLIPGTLISCDWPGLTPAGCTSNFYCDGKKLGALCPSFIGRSQAWRGDFALRVHFDVDRAYDAFSGLIVNVGGKDARTCAVNRQSLDISRYETLSLRVRANAVEANAEIALRDADNGETVPKAVLVRSGDAPLPVGEWVEKRLSVCELLGTKAGNSPSKLRRDAIDSVLVGFAKSRFLTEGTYSAGTHHLDLDDIVFLPCPTTGCAPCL